MKRITTYTIFMGMLMLVVACGRPDLLVINYVNRDGSVHRKIIMTFNKDDFNLADMQVPVDSSWSLRKDLEITARGDSLWTVSAEKFFSSVELINNDYDSHEGVNRRLKREARFESRFRWFRTIYYFSENVGKALDGYPIEDYLEKEELNLFYMPEKLKDDLLAGEDSLNYKAMIDTIEEKKELWIGKSLVKAGIDELEILVGEDYKEIDIGELRSIEDSLAELLVKSWEVEKAVDTLAGYGFYQDNRAIIDSALAVVEDKFNIAFDAATYLVQTGMPGELLSTNGYIDTDGNILWEVNGDIIFTKNYVMYAESAVTNWWAWVVSGLFVVFVIGGMYCRLTGYRRGRR